MPGRPDIKLTIVGDATSLARTLKKSSDDLSGFGSKAANFAKGAALALGAVGVAAVGMGISMVKAAEESAQVSRQTDAVLKSMGATAWTTADAVAGLSEKLSAQTGIDDELIQSGQNVLLTFANVQNQVGKGNAIFDRATTAALDMSVALGQDMQSSVTQLGKALNDPVKGISALSRVGIQFTADQKEMIETLVASGDVLGAQKIIMAEVERQFAGSAEAQATASQKIAVAWGNVQEALGEKLLPVFNAVSGWILSTGIPTFERFSNWLGSTLGPVIQSAGIWIREKFLTALQAASTWFKSKMLPRLQEFAATVKSEVIPQIQRLAGWFQDNLLPAIKTLAEWVGNTLLPALVSFGTWLAEHERVLGAIAIGITAMLVPAFVAWAVSAGAAAIATIAAAAPLILLGAAVAAFAYLVITHWDTIKNVTITVFNAVKDAIAAAFNWVKDNWPLLLAILTGPIGLAVVVIKSQWDKIKSGATAVKDWIVGAFNAVVSFFAGLPGRISAIASGMWDSLLSSLKSVANAIIGVLNGIGFTFEFHQSLPGPIPDINIGPYRVDPIPNIPYLAEGGLVTQPTLAMIGEAGPEAVVPLSRGGSGMGTGTIVNVYAQGSILSEKDVVRIIRDAIDQGALVA